MSKYNKLIVSVIGTMAIALTTFTGIEVQPGVVETVVGLLTSFLVWLVPNT